MIKRPIFSTIVAAPKVICRFLSASSGRPDGLSTAVDRSDRAALRQSPLKSTVNGDDVRALRTRPGGERFSDRSGTSLYGPCQFPCALRRNNSPLKVGPADGDRRTSFISLVRRRCFSSRLITSSAAPCSIRPRTHPRREQRPRSFGRGLRPGHAAPRRSIVDDGGRPVHVGSQAYHRCHGGRLSRSVPLLKKHVDYLANLAFQTNATCLHTAKSASAINREQSRSGGFQRPRTYGVDF